MAELVDKIRTTHAELEAVLATLSDEEMLQPGVAGDWTSKDILAHLTFWEREVLDYIRIKRNGEEPEDDKLPGEDSATRVNRINEANYQRTRDLPLDEVQAAFAQTYSDMVSTVETILASSPEEIKQLEELLGCEIEDCFEGDTYEHYEEHAASIRDWKARSAGA